MAAEGPVKVSPESVDYRRTRGVERCGLCSMYRPGALFIRGRCTLVTGEIAAANVCDRFDAAVKVGL